MDLAKIYQVETRALKQAVRRNLDRFPEDFLFQLTETEMQNLVSQNVIPHIKYFGGTAPFVFTEQGVAMLSSILKSKKNKPKPSKPTGSRLGIKSNIMNTQQSIDKLPKSSD